MSLQEIKNLPPELIAEMQADLQLEQRRAQLETGYQKNILELEKTRDLYAEKIAAQKGEIAIYTSREETYNQVNPEQAATQKQMKEYLEKELARLRAESSILEARNQFLKEATRDAAAKIQQAFNDGWDGK